MKPLTYNPHTKRYMIGDDALHADWFLNVLDKNGQKIEVCIEYSHERGVWYFFHHKELQVDGREAELNV